MREKWPSGGIDRRSITCTPDARSAQTRKRSNGNSGRQPSRRAMGANHSSKRAASRSPAPM
jgi:hypothetical protein